MYKRQAQAGELGFQIRLALQKQGGAAAEQQALFRAQGALLQGHAPMGQGLQLSQQGLVVVRRPHVHQAELHG